MGLNQKSEDKIIKENDFYKIDKFYELEEEKKREDNFDNFIQKYDNVFNKFSWNNEVYSKLLLHSLLSKLFNKVYISIKANTIDNRINLMLIQTQGTGKGKGMIMIKKIIEKLNEGNENPIKINSISDYTDAGLIGTIVETKVGKETVHVVRNGILSEEFSDIVYMEEAKIILASSKNRKESNVFQYINTGLNSLYSGENVISKEMRLGTVKCKVNACFILTTYPTPLADIEGLKSGFYRRILTYYNNLSISELKDNNKILIDSIISSENQSIEYENKTNKELDELVEDFKKYINNYNKMINNDKLRIGIGSYVGGYIEKEVFDLIDRYNKDLNDEDSKILISILGSYISYALIIASHKAIINNSTIISREDIIYSFDIVKKVMGGLENYIDYVYESNSDWRQKDKRNLVINIRKYLNSLFKNQKRISKMDLVKQVKDYLVEIKMPRSEMPIYSALKELQREKFIKIEKDGRNSWVMLY